MSFLGGIALAAAMAAQTPGTTADPCAGDSSCRQASAADLFAAADAMASEGDLAGAESLLQALTADPAPELRAEARFRLASIRERLGDLAGAVAVLRALLAEKPDAHRARLELGRILALQGDAKAARWELRQAEAGGLPADVAWTVRRFSTALVSQRHRGASFELVVAADSNINRSTSDRFVDTIIAPFELDADARGQSGLGVGVGGEAWSRDVLLGVTLLSRIGLRGDFFAGKEQFDDVQFSLTSGPELTTPIGQIRPAFAYERRWYGGDGYSKGYGGSLNWLMRTGARGQLQFDAALVHQSIRRNPLLDGHRYTLSATYDHIFTPESSARISVRGAALDAAVRPESLRQAGGDALFVHAFPSTTIFAQIAYTRTEGRAPLFLFGKTRKDDRIDLGVGLIAHRLEYRGFVPLARLLYTDSQSNLALYDHRRTRLEIGFSRQF